MREGNVAKCGRNLLLLRSISRNLDDQWRMPPLRINDRLAFDSRFISRSDSHIKVTYANRKNRLWRGRVLRIVWHNYHHQNEQLIKCGLRAGITSVPAVPRSQMSLCIVACSYRALSFNARYEQESIERLDDFENVPDGGSIGFLLRHSSARLKNNLQ